LATTETSPALAELGQCCHCGAVQVLASGRRFFVAVPPAFLEAVKPTEMQV
jgi:hypothetical protein